jgi:hypothetical protein
MFSHPRLIFSSDDVAQLPARSTHPVLAPVTASLLARAESILKRPPLSIATGNACRHHQGRVLTLALTFLLTQRPEFRDGAVRELDWALAQDDWKWNPAIGYSNLLTGEISMTFGLAYDWLFNDLTVEERERIRAGAEEKGLNFYLSCSALPEPQIHRVSLCNWNTVTNGGAAVLALALEGESTLAGEVLQQAVSNMKYFWDYLGADGGWCEGLSYWRYGMRYAFLAAEALRRCGYDAEQLGGRDAFAHSGVAQTCYFPMLFQPGQKLEMSFADSSGRTRMPVLYLLGREYSNPDFIWYEDREPLPPLEAEGWPMEVFALLWRPLNEAWLPEMQENFQPGLARAAIFPSIGWAMLASSQPEPEYCLAFKNGSLAVSHTHLDLNHVSVAVGEEYLLCDLGRRPYTSDYFGDARYKYYELDTRGHNTLLIGGRGQRHRAAGELIVPDQQEHYDYLIGVADGAYQVETTKVRRHVVFVRRGFWVLLDEVETPEPQNIELRFHTYADIEQPAAKVWRLTQNSAALNIVSLMPDMEASLEEPDEWIKPIKVLSLRSARPAMNFVGATLLVPHSTEASPPLAAQVECRERELCITFRGERILFSREANGWQLQKVSSTLHDE